MVDALVYGTSWCMVDVLVYEIGLLQVDAWLMHGSGYWYRLFGAG
jgi:hypothetical protein